MKPFVEMIYLTEILSQAEAGIRAVRGLQTPGSPFFDHAADFLNRAAVISKILKPSNADASSPERLRGRYLRGAIGVGDTHPVLDRTLRDLLEHIDESLDRWVAEAEGQGFLFVDKTIGIGINAPGRDPDKYTLRSFEPTTSVYTVLGKKFNLKAQISSVQEVQKLAASRLQVVQKLMMESR